MSLGKLIGFFVLVICLYILWQIRQVLLLVFTAVILANALNTLVRRFQKWGLPRPWAILLAISTVLTVVIGVVWLIVPSFLSQLEALSNLLPQAIRRLNLWLFQLRMRLPNQLTAYLPNVESLIQQLQPLVNQLLGRSLSFFSSSFGFILNFLLVLVLTLMLLSDPLAYRRAFVRLFPSFYRRRVEEILDRCEEALKGWLAGILFNMSVIAVFSGLGLWLLGIPLVLSQAALAGLLTFIPNIGPALSVVPPMAIALLQTPVKSIAVLVLYIVIQQVESNLLTPFVMAQQVSLLPAVTLLSQIFFATFFGFFGLFLALPLTVVAQVWLQEVLIKDVLDGWHAPIEQRASLVTGDSSIVRSPDPETSVNSSIVSVLPQEEMGETSNNPATIEPIVHPPTVDPKSTDRDTPHAEGHEPKD